MYRIPFFLLLCATWMPPAARAAPEALTADEAHAVEGLLPRHQVLSCEAIRDRLADPVASLGRLAERFTSPPWVGLRAARCLTDLAEDSEAAAHLLRWTRSPELAGLATVVLDRLDQLDPTAAQALARAALQGPHADLARTRLARSTRPALEALLEPR